MEENELYDRIGETDLNPTYKDGQPYMHTDINQMLGILKTAINENYYDIQRLLNGVKTVGNANKLDEATLSRYIDEELQSDDNKIPSSQQAKAYMDALFAGYSAPVRGVDYWTEADQQQIVSDTASNVIEEITPDLEEALNAKANINDVPTKVSDLTNDEEFITKDVDNLTNYYKKEVVNKKPYYFNNVAEMKAYNLSVGDMVITKGYYSENDGGSETYNIVDDSTLTQDNRKIINLANGLKAVLVTNSNKKYIDDYIMYCNSVSIDGTVYLDWLPAFNKAISEKNIIYLKRKTYYISDTIDINSTGFSIIGESKWRSIIQPIPNSTITGNGIINVNSNHVTLTDFHIRGNDDLNNDEKTAIYTVGGSNSVSTHSLIKNIVISHIKGDGITTELHSYDLHIENTIIYYVNNAIIQNSTDCYFSNIIVNSCKYNGIEVYGTSNSFSQVKVYQVGQINENSENTIETGYGFLINGFTNYFSNCQAQECGYDGFKINEADGTVLSGCSSDSNGRYIDTAIGINVYNSNYCKIDGIIMNKYFLNSNKNWNMITGVKISGGCNYINCNCFTIGNSGFNKYIGNECIFNNDISNTIIINGQNKLNADYSNNLDRPNVTYTNRPIDFTVENVGASNPTYSVNTSEHYSSITISNANNNSNAKFKIEKEVNRNIFANISLYVERKDTIKENTSSFMRIRFYNGNSEISNKTIGYSSFYNLQYNSRLAWNACFDIVDIPENTTKFIVELVNSATSGGVSNTTYFRNFKYLLS